MSKFTCFLGGPNGPKIYAKRTKTDFKDRVPDFLLDQMTSHIMNKLSSLLLSIQTISSIGLAWIGNTQLSTEVFLKLSLNSAQTFKDVELVALLNDTFRYQVVIQAQVTHNIMSNSCKLCQDKKSLKPGLRILNPKGSSLLRIRMKNPRNLDPRTTIPRTTNPRTMNPRISNPLKTQIYNQGSRILNPRIKDP